MKCKSNRDGRGYDFLAPMGVQGRIPTDDDDAPPREILAAWEEVARCQLLSPLFLTAWIEAC